MKTIHCDRCQQDVPNCDDHRNEDGSGFTCGYYNTEPGSYWARYAKPGENKICDACMFADAGYRKDYNPPVVAY